MAASAKVVGRRHFPRRMRLAVSLALIEAVDNAILHAHSRRHELPIRVEMEVGKGAVALEVADCGPGLDHRLPAEPPALAVHGRGLFLIHQLMDEVKSRRVAGGHVLRMVCRI